MTRKPLLPAAAALLLSTLAWAAPGDIVATITYAPLSAGAQAVPTLSQWGLAALALALAALAPRLLRGGMLRAVALGLLAGAALLAAPWSAPAMARPSDETALDQPGGGTAQLLWQSMLGSGDFFYPYALVNTTGKPQRITAIEIRGYRLLDPDDAQTCQLDMVLRPGDTCALGLGNPRN